MLYYLERHIELDGNEYEPLTLEMICELCNYNKNKWNEVLVISKRHFRKEFFYEIELMIL